MNFELLFFAEHFSKFRGRSSRHEAQRDFRVKVVFGNTAQESGDPAVWPEQPDDLESRMVEVRRENERALFTGSLEPHQQIPKFVLLVMQSVLGANPLRLGAHEFFVIRGGGAAH